MPRRKKVIIMGAAGRDFHNFNVFFRNNPDFEVVCFTATQIPSIENRIYPPELSGELYPNGIPIYPEDDLPDLIKKHDVDLVVLAYSDISYEYVMRRSAIVNSLGADFMLLGPKSTMLRSEKPVIAVTAVRTGCGKSQISRKIFEILSRKGIKPVSIRHPMPYDTDLAKQVVQRFSSYEDLDRYNCTIEEREEYEPYIDMGGVVYAGIDYERILKMAQKESDVIIWDGGNNDFPFIKPDLWITVVDPHRAGHEIRYYPGEVNFRSADVIIINKVNTAGKEDVEKVKENIREVNPDAKVIEAVSEIRVDNPDMIKDKRVLVIEDGPTVTHGEMNYGAGYFAAIKYGAKEIIDPRPFAVGSILETFRRYPHLSKVLPAMGYGKRQIEELEQTINRCDADLIVSGTPIDLNRILDVDKPIVRVRYGVDSETEKKIDEVIEAFLRGLS
ncbi:MAG TPA: GTPase [Thermoplasmatales archaeon]|nr:GTPase [Thermoplasmatales archaeon]HEX17596.1 GTPase [Thermoplasmatales archaeon]